MLRGLRVAGGCCEFGVIYHRLVRTALWFCYLSNWPWQRRIKTTERSDIWKCKLPAWLQFYTKSVSDGLSKTRHDLARGISSIRHGSLSLANSGETYKVVSPWSPGIDRNFALKWFVRRIKLIVAALIYDHITGGSCWRIAHCRWMAGIVCNSIIK
jgi:hypothetical protein